MRVIPQTKEEQLEGLAILLRDNLKTLQNECTKEMSGKILQRVEQYINLTEREHGRFNDENTREGV